MQIQEYEFPEDDESDRKKKIHLQLWDTAGQERYKHQQKIVFVFTIEEIFTVANWPLL